ncbi:MAG: histidinol-phosphatase HisJ family protein [Rhodospirillales bacterium]|jgi:histidinol-phosphatase (PHP family)|nr:histidinol-phosphatase HisJ family protein [Rhodospirillales bacterium]
MSHPSILYESHMHTPLCGHAVGEPEEYARVAAAKGLSGIIVTCHNPLPGPPDPGIRMGVERFDEYCKLVERARAGLVGIADVRLGMECDFYPGLEEWLEKQVGWADFDYVLGSVHPHLPQYERLFRTRDTVAYQRTYFEHLAQSAESGFFDALGHPDLIKIVEPSQWRPERIAAEIDQALDRIALTGVAMELNTSGLPRTVGDVYPHQSMLAAMKKRGIPVVIGADAHVPERVADGYDIAFKRLTQAGYTEVSYFLERKRIDVPIAAAQQQVI